METTKFKINTKYKLLNAIGFLAILLAFLLIYYVINNSTKEILTKVFTWGIPIVLLYCTFILRMKIEITENNKLRCKPANNIFVLTINISQIRQIELQEGLLFSKVVVYYNKTHKVVLHPDNPILLMNSLKKA